MIVLTEGIVLVSPYHCYFCDFCSEMNIQDNGVGNGVGNGMGNGMGNGVGNGMGNGQEPLAMEPEHILPDIMVEGFSHDQIIEEMDQEIGPLLMDGGPLQDIFIGNVSIKIKFLV